LTRAKSGRISFLDVLSVVPPFSEGLLAVCTKHQYSSDLWPLSLKAKRNCIVDKLLKILIKLIMKKLMQNV
jgi:hypothetical protein